MRARSIGTFSVWLAVTGAAVAVSWYGLQPVLNTAVPDRASPLSAENLRQHPPPATPAPGATSPSQSPQPAPASTPPGPPGQHPDPTRPSAGTAANPGTGSGGGKSSPANPPAPNPGRTSSGPTVESSSPTTMPAVDGWTPVTESDGSQWYMRRFESRGGQVTASVREGQVKLVSATPDPAYAFSTDQSTERLVVKFWKTGAMSTVDVFWYQGGPYYRISEQ